MTNKRVGKVVNMGRSMGLVLPKDWTAGNDLHPGDSVEIAYDGVVRVRPIRKVAASDAGASAPSAPAAQPARPAVTDDGGIVRESG